MQNPTYERPTLTDLGAVEDLTQVVVTFKISVPGTDVHINKNGVEAKKNQPQAGFTVSTG